MVFNIQPNSIFLNGPHGPITMPKNKAHAAPILRPAHILCPSVQFSRHLLLVSDSCRRANPRPAGRRQRLAARRPADTGYRGCASRGGASTTAERRPHLHGAAVETAPRPDPGAARPRPAFRARLPRCLRWRLRQEHRYVILISSVYAS